MFGKRNLLILTVVFTVLAAATFFVAPMISAYAAACREKANGHGGLRLESGAKRQFSFSATGNGDGTAKGNVVLINPEFNFRANFDVQCLSVVGNRARVAGVVRKITEDPELNEGDVFVFQVTDNGEPGRGTDTISRVFFTEQPFEANPLYCSTFENLPEEPIDNGNIHVRDCP